MSSTFMCYSFYSDVGLTFKFFDETLVSDHSSESLWALLLCGTSMLYRVILNFALLDGLFESVNQTRGEDTQRNNVPNLEYSYGTENGYSK